ncbi:sulfotransferase domain-containing protein [Robertmurraya sp. GLU-23]
MNDLRKNIVCVLGMHRSGTSALTRCINLLGVNIGKSKELLIPREDNPLGFWENTQITSINDEILQSFYSSWDQLLPLTEGMWGIAGIEKYKNKATDILSNLLGNNESLLIKDPRTSVTLPLWLRIFEEKELNDHYLISIRNPIDVFYSLQKRDKISLEKALYLWTLYNLHILYWTKGKRRIFISYDNLLEKTSDTIDKISGFLNISQKKLQKYSEVYSFLKPNLRHSKSNLETLNQIQCISDVTKKLYSILLNAENDISSLEKIGTIRFIEDQYYQFVKSPILIWGASKGGVMVHKKLKERGIMVNGFLDSNSLKWDENLLGLPIYSPNILKENLNIWTMPIVVIGSSYKEQIITELKKNNYSEIKVFTNLL